MFSSLEVMLSLLDIFEVKVRFEFRASHCVVNSNPIVVAVLVAFVFNLWKSKFSRIVLLSRKMNSIELRPQVSMQ